MFLHETLHYEKFKSTSFKNYNTFFQILKFFSFFKTFKTTELSLDRHDFDSSWRSHQQISLSPCTARPTQPSIIAISVNEYRIIPAPTPCHRWWPLPQSITGGMTDGSVPTIPGGKFAHELTRSTEPRFMCAQLVLVSLVLLDY